MTSTTPATARTLRFPAGFTWGAATAAHQVEGGNTNNDWWEFEHDPSSGCAESSGDACGSFERWEEDLRIAAELGLGSYRFSLEWSRIEPAEAEWSAVALEHYRRICARCLELGIEPTVTLHHFTLPRWMARRGGFESDRAPELFGRYCEKAVSRLGDLVARFCTINEPNIVSLLGYEVGVFPPGRKGDLAAVDKVNEHLIAAHRRGVDAVRSGPGNATVGMTFAAADFATVAGGDVTLAGALETERQFVDGAVGDDFFGVQCYSRWHLGPAGTVPPPDGTRLTQMGWEFWPQSVEACLRRIARNTSVPLLVTENGIATQDDDERIEYVSEALAGVHRCLEDGIDVRGYFYWSLLDNFEWAEGYRPRFGLVAVDRASFSREPKPSARWYGSVARSGELVLG